MHPSVEADGGDSTLARLHAPSKRCCDGPGEGRAEDPIQHEGELVLALDAALVLPWDAFWVRSELTEAVGDPRVTLNVFLKEVHILAFHLLRRHGRCPHLEDLISFFGHLV